MGVRVCAIAWHMGTPIRLGALDFVKTDPADRVVIFPKRMGRPEEFAPLVKPIASNPYLSGENIRPDVALRFAAK